MNSSSNPSRTISEADMQTLIKAAENGQTEAQYQLGMVYSNADGVQLDYKKAVEWLAKASSQKHAGAMRTLAFLYANGFGVEQDDQKAQQLCIELAEMGEPRDQYYLGSLYQSGIYGMQPDDRAMIYWYYQAAQQQYPRAQYALGKLILKGRGIEQNNEMAFQWLSLASAHGHEKAGDELRKLMEKLSPQELELYKQRMTEAIQASMAQENS